MDTATMTITIDEEFEHLTPSSETGRIISDRLIEALSNDLSDMLHTLKTGTTAQAKHAVGKCAEMLESLHAVL